MARSKPFAIQFSPAAESHLRALSARQQRTVLEAIQAKLRHQPDVQTRNRKPLRPNSLATWELRIGDLRVYYFIAAEAMTVSVVAVGIKLKNRVVVAGEEFEL